MKNILVIPDTQVREGVNTDHLEAAGNFAVYHKPDNIVFIGDVADTPSLSMYNNKKEAQGLTVKGDMEQGIHAVERLLRPLRRAKGYNPSITMCSGNHEPSVRIKRLYGDRPELEGCIDDEFERYLLTNGIKVVPFLEVETIEGIAFSHYFCNPSSLKGNPVSGMIESCIKNVGHSFVAGHQQGLKMGKRYLANGEVHLGIICGSFYSHEESYMSKQSNHHWRGIVHLMNASEGDADIQEVNLKTLLRDYM